jgi:ATP-dependent DNA helicase RecQ
VSSRFDDGALEEFAKSREILSVREHFFVHGEIPHLLLCISWRMPPAGSARPPTASEDWKGLLTTPEQKERFDRLRRWRNETAKKEGKPAYAILTNRMAAEVAVLPSPTVAALGHVPNLGPAKLERYGRRILETLGVVEAADG